MTAPSNRAMRAWTLQRSYGFGAAGIRIASTRVLPHGEATREETLRTLPTLLRETRGRGVLGAALALTALGALAMVVIRPIPDSLARTPLEMSWWAPSIQRPAKIARVRPVAPLPTKPTPPRVETKRPEPKPIAAKPAPPPPKPVIDAVRALPGVPAAPAAPSFRAPQLAVRRNLPVPARGGIAIESPRRSLTPERPDGTALREVAALRAPALPAVSARAERVTAVAPIEAPAAAAAGARRNAAKQKRIAGVPLSALASCPDPREEDRLKQRVLGSVGSVGRCTSRAGQYHFVQMNNLNAFLMSIERSADRNAENRCGELRRALACLASIGPEEGAS